MVPIENVFHQFYQDINSLPVLMRGLQAAVLISIVCATLSVFVVLKRLAFIGEGIAHSALGGIALGIMLFVSGSMTSVTFGQQLGIDLTTVIFCVVIAWLIGWTSRQKIISEDTAIGIFFVASLAFGIMLISLRKEYTAELFSFLFGSVLAVGSIDVYVTLGLVVLVLFILMMFYRPLFLFCLDEELAGVSGLPVGWFHYMMLTVLAVTIVVSIKILGVLLVAAFLVIPGATARMLTYRYRNMFIIANLIGLVAVLSGLILSDLIEDLPSGPAIVLGEFLIFLLAMGWGRFRDRHLRSRQLTVLGTSLVLVIYIGVFLLIACKAYAIEKAPVASASSQLTQIDSADWNFFISSLQKKSFDDINQRIDSDAAFMELLTRRIKVEPISEKEKQSILKAIDTMDWSKISAETIRDLSSRH
jgi:ABC-type Mn2+/Zn2+ transport system permease subunit